MKLRAEESAALFIDFQEKLMPAIHDVDAIMDKTVILAKGLQEFGVPVAFSQQYTKGLGETLPILSEAVEGFSYMDKTSFSCCDCDEIVAWVKSCGKKNILVCGAEAHICVMQTVLDLMDAGMNVFVVADCIGSRKPYDKEMGIKRMEKEGAYMTTCEAALFEMTGGAKSPHFKVISKLVK